jgi:hypothetical protein
MVPDSYELSGDVRSGLKGTVQFLVAWKDGIQFANDMVASPKATRIGTITWTIPDRFAVPFGGLSPRMYAQSFKIKPCGAVQGLTGGWYPNFGLNPGEYYTHALVTLNYESVAMVLEAGDDQSGLNQLDPTNPITGCEQAVSVTGKMITKDGAYYKYVSSGLPVSEDVSIIMNEAKLTLTYPQVPYLPWQAVQPFIGKINNSAVLGCARGTLLFEGMDTKITPMPNGLFGQNATLKFAWNAGLAGYGGGGAAGADWNIFPLKAGGYDVIVDGAGNNLYAYAEFSQLLLYLQFG